jgi:hypothetical protein
MIADASAGVFDALDRALVTITIAGFMARYSHTHSIPDVQRSAHLSPFHKAIGSGSFQDRSGGVRRGQGGKKSLERSCV